LEGRFVGELVEDGASLGLDVATGIDEFDGLSYGKRRVSDGREGGSEKLTTSRLLARRDERIGSTALADGRFIDDWSWFGRECAARSMRKDAGLVVVDAFGAFKVVRATVAAVLLGRDRAAITVGLL
jgi:hypothetical protein